MSLRVVEVISRSRSSSSAAIGVAGRAVALRKLHDMRGGGGGGDGRRPAGGQPIAPCEETERHG